MKRADTRRCYGVTDTAVEWGRSIKAPTIGLCPGVPLRSVSAHGMTTRRGAPNFLSMLSNMLDRRNDIQRGARVRLTLTNGDDWE